MNEPGLARSLALIALMVMARAVEPAIGLLLSLSGTPGAPMAVDR